MVLRKETRRGKGIYVNRSLKRERAVSSDEKIVGEKQQQNPG